MIDERLREIDQELSEIGNPENDYKRFIELLMEYNKLKYFKCMKQLEELLMEENDE